MSSTIYFEYNKYVIYKLKLHFRDDKNVNNVYKYIDDGKILINISLVNHIAENEFKDYVDDIKKILEIYDNDYYKTFGEDINKLLKDNYTVFNGNIMYKHDENIEYYIA